MMESYYPGEEAPPPRRSNLDAPRVTVNNHRMTNVQLTGGDVVQGIRRNNDLGHDGAPQAPFESAPPLRPLRYTPGLKCDPALEALRPERDMKHSALQGGDTWRNRLIQTPQTYQGSFAEAPMQQFRPNPGHNAMEDPWFMSRLPDQPLVPMIGVDPAYAQQDELSRIKMRNRRYQQSCAMEGMQQYGPVPAPPPMWRGPPPFQQQMTEDMMMGGMQDELSMINQDLNMTRRATRPFVPTDDPAYFDLQRQVNLLETIPPQPIRVPRVTLDDILSTDDLPAPAKRSPKEDKETPPKPARSHHVGIADQIAIRSYVLGKNIGKSAE